MTCLVGKHDKKLDLLPLQFLFPDSHHSRSRGVCENWQGVGEHRAREEDPGKIVGVDEGKGRGFMER